ncbi:cysteine hydrolase [Candidatus Bathyarchaeota archaeon]|nr:cysteine hydrolase [Candidatus Bathyarchaeota archaeon]
MSRAILVIDVINDFVSGVMGSERASRILSTISKLLTWARENHVPIIYVTDAHHQGIEPEFEIFPIHALDGSNGSEIVGEIKPERGDYHIKKRRYSGFYETGLDSLLRDLKVDTLIITGIVTNICVQHTAADAFFRGYKIIIPSDCVEALSDAEQEFALRYMEKIYGAEITTSQKVFSL